MKNLLGIFFLISSFSFAYEFNYLARSPKGLLLGDAYTTLATDSHSLFYNPALAARNDFFAFYPFPLQAGITNPIAESDRLSGASDTNDEATFANLLLDLPIHANIGYFPTIKTGWFTFTPYTNLKANGIIRNSVNPEFDLDYRYDRGFAVGLGFKRKSGTGSLAMGLAAKYISRQAIVGQFPVFGDKVANLIDQEDLNFSTVRSTLGYSEGKGWGFDFGLDYRYEKGPTRFAIGLAALDIGDTKIDRTVGELEMPDQQMNVAFGMSYGIDLTIIDWELSADIHPITANIDFSKKVHLGARFGIPLVDVLIGLNGGQFSYGVGVNLGFLEIVAGFYAQDRGESVGDETSQRAVIYASLLDFTFDGP